MKKHRKDMDKDSGKKSTDDQSKKDQNQRPHMKKPGDKGFIPRDEQIGDGSAGMGGTSAI
jgi:hypothetical protein